MRFTAAVASASLLAGVSASTNYLGFNSGNTFADRSAKFKADWVSEFTTAQNLVGTPGTFNAVRLYTNIQAYSTNTPIEAFDAAISTKTYILLGIWASGTTNIDNEIAALKSALTTHGSALTDLVIGVSIGSEDLYRNSVEGVKNKSGVGADPSVIVKFINAYKKAFANTKLASVPIGHVDTWDVWSNSSNKAVLDAVDWIGVDEYPFYETGKNNTIKNAGTLFDKAYDTAVALAGGKPVWVTETGWPTTGPSWDEAVPSVANAKYYWDEVGCRKLFNKTPTFWYNLRDSNPDNEVKFAITNNLSTKPYFDLSCPTTFDTPTSTSAATSAATSATATGKTTATTTTAKGASSTASSGSDSDSSASASAATTFATAGATASGKTAATSTAKATSTAAVVTTSAGRLNAQASWTLAGLALAAGMAALF